MTFGVEIQRIFGLALDVYMLFLAISPMYGIDQVNKFGHFMQWEQSKESLYNIE